MKQAALLETGDMFQVFGNRKVYKAKKVWYDYNREQIAIKVGLFKTIYIPGYLQVFIQPN